MSWYENGVPEGSVHAPHIFRMSWYENGVPEGAVCAPFIFDMSQEENEVLQEKIFSLINFSLICLLEFFFILLKGILIKRRDH